MVMGWIWTGMVLLALGAAVLTGQTGALTAAALEGAASAIRLALGLAGALCLWSGAAKALERAGGMRALARLARPVFRRLFPQTAQDETVVLLSKGEIDSKKVRVEFSLEDMDMSGFQKGATYEQIKAYVLEHTGLKVSSLYISQIKRKCGLDVGQNYNLSKKEDAKVPKCPPEKEAAIRDALKYFQMI